MHALTYTHSSERRKHKFLLMNTNCEWKEEGEESDFLNDRFIVNKD